MFTIPLMAIVKTVMFKINPCGTQLSEDNGTAETDMEIKVLEEVGKK
jgi:hypothetical protein